MKVVSVKINNFKSFLETDNVLILESGITPIVGKNESGKTNILEALSYIDFQRYHDVLHNKVLKPRIPGSDDKDIEYIIELESNDKRSEIRLKASSMEVYGNLLEYYNSYIKPIFQKILDEVKINTKSNDEITKFAKYKTALVGDNLDIPLAKNAIEYLNNKLKDTTDNYKCLLDDANEKWEVFISQLPIFYLRNDKKVLEKSYSVEEAKKAISEKDSLLKDFLKVIKTNLDDFVLSISSSDETARTKASRINKNIDKYINEVFSDFYKEEIIKLSANFAGSRVYFEISSNDGDNLSINERSNGLRWYLNLFIDILANNLEDKNVIYLFDEPGISLHVNAQKEILDLFSDLVSKGNQVVYTTHLPTMLSLDGNGIHRIRAVDKTSEGVSKIFKNAYDNKISKENIYDTLTPITKAIGMNLSDSFLLSKEKLNVVVEGMSDYIYLSEIQKLFPEYKDSFVFIPSVGAQSVFYIHSILYGWGCPVLSLLDYDCEGIKIGEKKYKHEYDYALNLDYIYVFNATESDIKNESYKDNPYMIEDLVGADEIQNFFSLNKHYESMSKTLIAKLFTNDLEQIPDNTKKSFEELFKRIDSIRKNKQK